MEKAKRMVDDAADAGAECVKFQCHVIEDEMSEHAKKVIPGNATESIYDIMSRCALSEEDDAELKRYVESKGMIFLSTPFSRAAADRLERMGVVGYKIGSGECNNYPLIKHIASFGKPVILSTGMNSLDSIRPAVKEFEAAGVPHVVLQCTSMYPTPYDKVELEGIVDLQKAFPSALVGLSDHSLGIWTALGAVAYGASVLEKHFTSDKTWPGPDVSISIDPSELRDLVVGSKAIWEARGGSKKVHEEEAPTIAFAYASVVTIADINEGDEFSASNLWVKRPGTGDFLAGDYDALLGKKAARSIPADKQLEKVDVA